MSVSELNNLFSLIIKLLALLGFLYVVRLYFVLRSIEKQIEKKSNELHGVKISPFPDSVKSLIGRKDGKTLEGEIKLLSLKRQHILDKLPLFK